LDPGTTSTDYSQRLRRAAQALARAEFVLVGGGAGLSDAAGLTYSGKRFTDHFEPFIARYGFADLYTSSFFPFATEEERWAYWARHISLNRWETGATPLYQTLLGLVGGKDHFVLTTNVDHQFAKAGFAADRIFATQGDYGYLQCARGCHRTLYDNEALVREMLTETIDCRIPTARVPHCPRCGGPMDVNLRKDEYFVEDAAWDAARERYAGWLQRALRGGLVLLELGVGFNTPGIIRFPFERIVLGTPGATLVRLNRDDPQGPAENAGRTVAFSEDLSATVGLLAEPRDA
jgi:NAD-dependent SIR2 family protein deacetylase